MDLRQSEHPLRSARAWLNGGPVEPDDLRGRIVLVNFWTYTCINWVRTAPHLRALARAYRDDGLVVVGVHTPEFSFEHDLARVGQAIEDRRLEHPVAVDNDYAVWDGFDNRVWPATYLLDGSGQVRAEQLGEGGERRLELAVQGLLGVERDPVPVERVGDEAPADWVQLWTPETYLGWGRSAHPTAPGPLAADRAWAYRPPRRLHRNRWALDGVWTVAQEHITNEGVGGRLLSRFHARDAHVVLSRSVAEPIPFHVRLDGVAPGRSAGVDVAEDGAGVLDGSRMYHLVRQQGRVPSRVLEIAFERPGAEAYVLTFG